MAEMTQVVHVRHDEYDLYIGRRHRLLPGVPTSRWANPYRIGRDGDRDTVLTRYEAHVRSRPDLLAALPELRGQRLACWCSPRACHGDVLIRLLAEQEARDG